MRARILDLFCGAGGAAMGYHRAGFEVIGVDIAPQPNYPFDMIESDAIEYLDQCIRDVDNWGWDFDAIHASPPCQPFTAYRRRSPLLVGVGFEDLLMDVRDCLQIAGLPYVIENVPGAPLENPIQLCGSSFGLDVRRHRLFESNVAILAPPCNHAWQTPRFPQATNRTNLRRTVEVGVRRIPLDVQQRAMGIDWMTREELSQAVPPAYTEFIGARLLEALECAA